MYSEADNIIFSFFTSFILAIFPVMYLYLRFVEGDSNSDNEGLVFSLLVLSFCVYNVINTLKEIRNDIIVDFSSNEIVTINKSKIIISDICEIETYEYQGKSASFKVYITTNTVSQIEFHSVENMYDFVNTVVEHKNMELIKETFKSRLLYSESIKIYSSKK